jgi:GMP synthase-like glutamine amidotransferase
MKIHYLQHVPFENPGSILVWAQNNGHGVSNTLLYQNEPFPEQTDFDWLIVMGGPMNIYEEEKYSWLTREKRFIKEAIEHKKVVIGLCLGSQLIADVIGGKVTQNPHREIGWFSVRLCEAARKNPLFSFLPHEPVVFQWHGDTFSTLPEEAELVAESDACAHQAFVYRSRIFGFQFHLENTMPIIERLVENCREEIIPGEYVQPPEELLSHPEYIRQDNMWMDTFLTRLYDSYRKGAI